MLTELKTPKATPGASGRFARAAVPVKITAALALAFAFGATSALGQNWTGGAGTTDWNTAGNWDTGVPAPTGNVVINTGTSGPVISSGEINITGLSMGVSPGTGALTINGSGTLHIGTGATRFSQNNMAYLTVTDNARLIMDATNVDFAYNNASLVAVISGSALVENSGTGSVIFGERTGGMINVEVKDHATWKIQGSAATGLSLGWVTGTTVFTIRDSAVVSVWNGAAIIGYGANSVNTLTLSGSAAGARGTLEVKTGVQTHASNANSKLIFDGGVLKALSGSAAFIRGPLAMITQGDGAFIDSNGFNIGIQNTATFTGTSGLTKLGAGALTLNNTIGYTGTTAVEAGAIVLTTANQLASSGGVAVAAGGTLSAANLAQTLNGLSGAGAVNIGTGAATLGGTGSTAFSGNLTTSSLTKTGPGWLTLSGSNTISGDTTLDGGVLAIGSGGALGAATGKTLTFVSGTLAGGSAGATFAHTIAAQAGSRVALDSGAGGFTVSGAITGNAGLAKSGAGDVRLTGNLSGLAGPVSVSQGMLLTGDLNAGVSVAAGAGFGGAGTINGDVLFAGAGQIQVGFTHNDSTVTASSTLAITGSLGFGGNAILRFDMYEAGADTLTAGSAGFGGSTTIDLVNIQTGTFTLFKLASGTFSSAFVSSLLTTQDGGSPLNLRANAAYTLSADQKELQLISGKTSHVVKWTGATDGNWDSATADWQGGDTAFLNGDKVIFDGSDTAGNRDIALQDTGIVVSELSFTGNGSYTFTGGRLVVDKSSAGTLGGSFSGTAPTGAFTVDTTGTITLSNSTANLFLNGIDLRKGTLAGNADTLGQSANIALGASGAAALVFDQSADAAFTGTLTGGANAVLGKTGTGTLLLTADNSGFTGVTQLNGGTLAIADGVTFGSILATGSGGSLLVGNGATFSGSATLWDANVTLGNNARFEGSAVVLGTNATITLGNNSSFGSTVNIYEGSIVAGDNVAINGNAIIRSSGSLALGANSVVTGTIIVHAGEVSLGVSSTVHGAITGTGGTKDVLLGANSFVGGPVIIRSGHIQLQAGSKINDSVTALGSGHVHLLAGSEIVGDVTMGGSDACVGGAGKIGGIVQTSSTTAAVIRVVTYTDLDTYSAASPVLLETGRIIFGSTGTIMGSGTLATPSIEYSRDLTIDTSSINNPLTITGSLLGSGTLIKTGSSTAILAAPSSYTGETFVNEGSLIAGVTGALSPNSPRFTVAAGASLGLGGFDHTLSAVVNNGRIFIGANNAPVAGAKLTVTGAWSGTGGVSFNLVANDGARPMTDQLVFADAANVSGTTKVFLQFTDNRADKTRVVYDIAPLIVAEAGALPAGAFKLDDGRGYERVVISQRDYVLRVIDNRAELTATTAAEMPGALAVNATSLFASRAALSSVGQRLDHLRTLATTGEDLNYTWQAWTQGYYREDEIDTDAFSPDVGASYGVAEGKTHGFQAGVDKRKVITSKTGKGPKKYVTYGAFMDYTESEADLPHQTASTLKSTGLGGYISTHAGPWHTDLVARYTWDKYKITVGSTSMDTDGYTWSGMARVAYAYDYGTWSLLPQGQLIYQQRDVASATDAFGRNYVFGPANMRLNVPASFEGRVGATLRKAVRLGNRISLAPYVSALFLWEFKGNLTVTTVNNTAIKTDFGGESYLFSAGLPVRVSDALDIYAEASLQTGGPTESHNLNLGVNYRW
ncbi:hypothetical protein AW736_18560 [Termitidicoccus mucosus]|uniref:Autotransporter domain-containing protein n=3 Tax=Termitidicoccus mucosus TaxID=1184151 RepID=A0A178IFZ2_9BACT|nr:hypothetical protein AW736_18560 [Opitutaceae bacterium TSB47]